jgi:hypothetical protein
MKISQKGLYALQAMMTLAHHHQRGTLNIWQIASDRTFGTRNANSREVPASVTSVR